MKEIQTKSRKILVVEIPENSNTFELISQGFYLRYKTGVFNNITGADDTRDIDLRGTYIFPEYKIIGKLSELTDEDCEKFVEDTVRCNNCYWTDCEDNLKTFVDLSEHVGKEIHYFKGCPECETDDYLMDIAKESFISLLQSEDINTKKEHLIIKIL